ncbi:YihA family ribosome biogenesis GTP-binding protein [Pelagibius litoralis]|uniref:Probable GTP-binding protein EngB n=1 Tax=Pelagibius litoralis TaxID=374515 RepID=A0A967KFE9_9PROT|nr:ribosome biogenesis GTP-binding protein YihA/YsxC [Pelagibius litoralis]NIA71280.1 YihA family ribosome biogenesis GTP-binding protein [Pelagibius litoralis]
MTEKSSPAADAAEAAALEAGRLLFSRECLFLVSAADEKQLPSFALSEVAFAGRSNVGKSSLVNALTGRKTLARTSNTPGRTRLLNFFELGERLILVDLPGYGYARASKTDIAQWSKLTRGYLKGRAQLRRVCLLIDSRHGLKASDKQVMDELDLAAVSYQVILTKADKMKAGALARMVEETGKALAKRPAAHPDCLVTSAEKGTGIDSLRAALAALAEPPAAE